MPPHMSVQSRFFRLSRASAWDNVSRFTFHVRRVGAMGGYRGFEEKKSKLGTTLLIVGVIHLGIGAGLYWVSKPIGVRILLKSTSSTRSEKKIRPLRLKKNLSLSQNRNRRSRSRSLRKRHRLLLRRPKRRPHRRPLMRLPARRPWMRIPLRSARPGADSPGTRISLHP